MKQSPHLFLAKKYWKEHLSPHDFAVDATCGNGYDTLFLSQLLEKGEVYAFDIQPKALENTKAQLPDSSRVSLFLASHANWDKNTFPKAPRLIVYNLGYLPKGDKQITTLTETTLQSLEKALQLLAPDGAISITCYPGHKEGEKEEAAILEFLSKIPSQQWTICHHRFLNRLHSPSLIWITPPAAKNPLSLRSP
jgi:SAM-dependent methyltransferase